MKITLGRGSFASITMTAMSVLGSPLTNSAGYLLPLENDVDLACPPDHMVTRQDVAFGVHDHPRAQPPHFLLEFFGLFAVAEE